MSQIFTFNQKANRINSTMCGEKRWDRAPAVETITA